MEISFSREIGLLRASAQFTTLSNVKEHKNQRTVLCSVARDICSDQLSLLRPRMIMTLPFLCPLPTYLWASAVCSRG